MEETKIKVGVVDDHALFRRGIANLLSEFEDILVVFDIANGRELQGALVQKGRVDVVLMDINMPVMDGYKATRWLKEQYPGIHVLALSMLDEDEDIIRMLKAGAGGYVLKESQPSELYTAIKKISRDGLFINDSVSGKLLRSIRSGDDSKNDSSRLTEREREFIKHCVSEMTYKEIAEKMGISPRSVDNYREALFEKLGIKSRVGLVLFALKNGIVDL
jgi:DNA-binding NarL/FixJ family response regulator